jgi:alpha-1,4-galacturonosyltransferase
LKQPLIFFMHPYFFVFGHFFRLQVFDAITASQQESGTLSVDFFRNHASPSWKTDDLVTEKSMDVNDNAKAENSLLEHSVPTNRSPKDPGTEYT